MKPSRTVLIVAVICLACSFYGRPLHEVVERRVLLPAEQLHRLERDPNPHTRGAVLGLPDPYWDPSLEQVQVCESLLSRHWVKDRKYNLQYMGITERGWPVIFLLGTCTGSHTEEDLASFPLIMMDAGRCYFVARCWPSQERILSFHFSGR